MTSAATRADNSAIRTFWVGPAWNDTIPLGCQQQVTGPYSDGRVDASYTFSVPAGQTWYITVVNHMLYCGEQSQNAAGVFMHIYFNQPSYGINTQVWSEQAHFAQIRGEGAISTPNGVAAPSVRIVTDVGEGKYSRFFHETTRIPIPGPGRVEVGMFNDNIPGGPAASAMLTFCVEKDRP